MGAELDAQMLALPAWVQMWMNWMVFILMASIVFVWNRKGARAILSGFILTMPAALGLFWLEPNIHLFGLAHLVLWVPVLIYVWRVDFPLTPKRLKSPYGSYLALACSTMVISLLFDIRDLVLVALGQK